MLNYYIITIFPELFQSRASIALFSKAIDKNLIRLHFINPRDFTTDKHQTVDGKIYGGGEGLLMKAKPVIDATNAAVQLCSYATTSKKKSKAAQKHSRIAAFKIIYPAPSQTYFNQKMAFDLSYQAIENTCNNLIFVCGRYEGIDERFEQYFQDLYPNQFLKVSLGKYIVYGGEVPSMLIMEAITRLLPGGTHKPPLTESYYPEVGEDTIENPHYTRPQEVYWYKIPEILLSGHHKNIDSRRDEMMK